MPLIIKDLLQDLNAKGRTKAAHTPKFFSSELTGNGGKSGVLDQNLFPGTDPATVNTTGVTYDASRKRTYHNGDTEIRTIPTDIFPEDTLRSLDVDARVRAVLDVDQMHVVAPAGTWKDQTGTPVDHDLALSLTPQGAVLYRVTSRGANGNTYRRSLHVNYRMELLAVTDDSTRTLTVAATGPLGARAAAGSVNPVALDYSYSPAEDLAGFLKRVSDVALDAAGKQAAEAWMRSYSLHDAMSALAEIWATDEAGTVVSEYVADVFAAAPAGGRPSRNALNGISEMARHLESHPVQLTAYRTIQRQLKADADDAVRSTLAKMNLQLLLTETLDALDSKKPALHVLPHPVPAGVVLPSYYSDEQRAAISTREPLSIVIAGAGSGKTTVILERIKYMVACGMAPQDITVLSFTNAAADNVIARSQNVNAMTIASMINSIYEMSHPTHELSSIETMANSIEVEFPQNDLAKHFRNLLRGLDKSGSEGSASMNRFVEANYDAVVHILDKIGQTCLEMQIILCYQRIDTMPEPANVLCKALIIDEVQDNSIFEFIFVLRWVAKHNTSLFIVGDPSQTLFEFRNANPKAMNAIEASGVFSRYRLQTNYRSCQEILDFANKGLGEIEANSYAQIQLRANSLNPVTEASFTSRVKLDCRHSKQEDLSRDLPGIVSTTVARDYIDPILARGEKVTLLAYSRRDVKSMQEALQAKYPNIRVGSLVSDKPYDTSVFSAYINLYWNDVKQVPPYQATYVIEQEVIKNIAKLISKKANATAAEKSARKMLQDWRIQNHQVQQNMLAQVQLGAMSVDAFFEALKKSLLSHEIRANSVRQSMVRNRNEENKRLNEQLASPITVSTVHGAKGLEFQNVVVVYNESTKMSEDVKRLYYVAFTRAIESMYVLASSLSSPAKIQSDYDTIVATLRYSDARAAAVAAGQDPDEFDVAYEQHLRDTVAQQKKDRAASRRKS